MVSECLKHVLGCLVWAAVSSSFSTFSFLLGGAARTVTAIHEIHDAASKAFNLTTSSLPPGWNASNLTHDVYTLHAGDALTGSLFYTAYGPQVDATWMNAANVFDVMVLGNHEFDEVRLRPRPWQKNTHDGSLSI
jgi:hypothetical protein